jgi:hypothetical protein
VVPPKYPPIAFTVPVIVADDAVKLPSARSVKLLPA